MIEEKIGQLVKAHYLEDGAPLLLLSNFGVQLSRASLWPIAGDTRTLHEVVKTAPGVDVIADPEAQSFLAVVLVGDERRAFDAIEQRHRLAFLRTIPRAVLLAFTVETEGKPIYIRHDPRPGYAVGPDAAPEGHLLVENEYRVAGLDVSDLRNLSTDQIENLSSVIRKWCQAHNFDPAKFKRRESGVSAPRPVERKMNNALERLFAAQSPEVAKRLSIPIDIALALSRLP